ncbi:hypothetical protein F0U61_09555 [Archangium violaceum]|uniref:hypothetical protein n=1 Tax=Archangium violaceum TaxID=83451 RepID=UPI002B2EAC81|nr:hypothetical protein F0U61_09555 [Archangium violaceum]
MARLSLSQMGWGLLLLASLLAVPGESPAQTFCTQCLTIRLGRPLVTRGPAADELDSPYNEIQLANGQRRGFSSNASSYAVDGSDPWSTGGARRRVLAPGAAGTYSDCGQWMNDTEQVSGGVHGFIHAERSCNYGAGQTHKSMAYGWSTDEGLSWSVRGQIITGTDAPTPGVVSGEGDCTVIDGKDGYLYAYCLRARDWRTIVARAPASNPGPGNWMKYFNGAWSQPGLGGDATALGFLGTSAGRWTANGDVLLLTPDRWFGGLRLSFSSNKVNFTSVGDPLIPLEDDNWSRPAPTELVTYPSVMNYGDVSNQVGSGFLLTYVYIQPGEGFDKRYLVFRDVWMGVAASPQTPQVGLALSRWFSATAKDRWTTTAPVVGNYNTYAYDKLLGYVMTKPHPTLPSNKLEDCVSTWPGHPDHLLTNDGMCASAGYTRLRTAGWLYRDAQPNTLPVYRCYSPTLQSHFASNRADCEGLGTMEWLLGYALAS